MSVPDVGDNNSAALRPTTFSRTSGGKNFNDQLYEYLFLELGTSKKDIFNFVHLGQSMRFANSNSKFY